ncbi:MULTISPECIES: aldehyde dehydrogenase family protein [unclassified Chelatococcus]|uniref:aldehyde dehydrogenase family protein n=1 Tax=unclassified Chelatococcus TaxID=2638111 RepID=UPI001BCDC7D8|nr:MULTISPECIES: aldehyde dehydrogenase family protein [unclassified Chelatococcus]MBS7700461.1 aldehyde dehydrogenase family protein [Chelatococcus sp. YT9]MBX3556257.1 aldehyde dehydrogenase family protein [Chelatococcus sp.]
MDARQFYIDGAWVDPLTASRPFAIVSPLTEQQSGELILGSAADVDRAVTAARKALPEWAAWSRAERMAILDRIVRCYNRRIDEVARVIAEEIGAPLWFARDVQAVGVATQFSVMRRILETYAFEHYIGTTLIRREPFGVCGLITAWNWPLNLIAGKLAPALATGCTVVLKPSEYAPLSTLILTEVLEEAGLPKGVFNMVQGTGAEVGEAIAGHSGIDMVSITGSTRAGALVAKAAADTVKRVHQELGGKSAHIITADADLQDAVPWGVARSFMNSGQSCEAPTRMLVHRDQLETVNDLARKAAETYTLGHPFDDNTKLGPLVNAIQFERAQDLIQSGIDQGATLVTGGIGRPAELNSGYFVKPTVFSDVKPDMRIAVEEIFAPVLSIMPYETIDEAVEIANSSVYGLAAYVHGEHTHATELACRLQAGRVYINGAASQSDVPFGGYKQSGNGRQSGIFGFEDYLEIKAVLGHRKS